MSEAISLVAPKTPTPFPWRQFSLVMAFRFVEPISFSIVFPFISEKIWTEFGVAKTKSELGFYSGLIESTFAITQTFTILHWGKLSDRIGRKKVILSGLTGVTASLFLFGFAKSLTTAIIARALAGALNGNAPVLKSLVGEITDDQTRALAMSYYMIAGNLAGIIGPLMGGFLSKPAESFPSVFSRNAILGLNGFWQENPYALPCFTSAALTFISIIFGFFFLDETLPSLVAKKKDNDARTLSTPTNYGAVALGEVDPNNSSPSTKPSAKSSPSAEGSATPLTSTSTVSDSDIPVKEEGAFALLKNPQIKKVILSYAYLSLSAIAVDAIFVLYLWTPIKDGGLSMSPKQSGGIFSLASILSFLTQFFLFPLLQKKLGTLKLYAICMSFFPIVALILPVTNLFARANLKSKTSGISILLELGREMKLGGKSEFNEELSENAQAIVWSLLIFSSACRVMSGISFSCSALLILDCAKLTSGESSGALNGLSQMAASLMRGVGPYSALSLFAFSISRHDILGGQLVWVVLFIIGLLGSWIVSKIEPMNSEEEPNSVLEDDASVSNT